mmetsp:Transcript_24210/g.77311  ORF Transcript_24210/g.77311 Transcript_24210/m.77311 type:complete len:374 (-) Transcript_24210:149-1270(-)
MASNRLPVRARLRGLQPGREEVRPFPGQIRPSQLPVSSSPSNRPFSLASSQADEILANQTLPEQASMDAHRPAPEDAPAFAQDENRDLIFEIHSRADGEELGSARRGDPRQQEPQPGAIAAAKPVGSGWQEFDSSTEAGRLLRRLYSQGHNKPLPKYPALRLRSNAEDCKSRPKWSHVQPNAEDPRHETERRQRERAVVIPRPRREALRRAAAISLVQRRKSHTRILTEQRESPVVYQVPQPRKAISTDFEKRRLALHFQFKGGKALPEAGTTAPMPGQIPLSLITGKPNARLARQARERKAASDRERVQTERASLENEFDSFADEVDLLSAHLDAAMAHPGGHRAVAALRERIQDRVDALRGLDDLIGSLKT